jgi:hypothetical protein
MKLRVLWTISLALALASTLAVSASAQDRNRDDQNRHTDQDRDHNRANRDVWQNRAGWEYRTYEGDRRPEGWNQGAKSEWRNCDDGTSRHQYDCYSYQYQGQPYYYYRDENGRMSVRRQHRDTNQDRDDQHRDRDHDRDDKH